ncbi:hypothetical protein F5144DRAFT_588471 [Chaetomium tenue]|uniref:Uncharacterized protein n=1 Tax=Chaetomium tenue TaxID=1854479 RepID=A0ACB7PLT8_9PEZI|nr:hypothetical protein F5144DRAFT_588471 [Chaetomium globosum]
MGKISKPLAEEIEHLGRENQRRQAGEVVLHGSCSLRIFRPFSRAAFNCVPRSFCGSPCFQQRRNTRREIETAQPPSPGCDETLSPAAEKSGSGPLEWLPACHRFATGNAVQVRPFVAHCPITTLPLLRALHFAAPAPPWPW